MILFSKQKEYEYLNNPDKYLSQILKIAQEYSLCGNLWRNFTAWLIINDENPFSVFCERRSVVGGSLYDIAKIDAKELFSLFNNPTACSVTVQKVLNDFDSYIENDNERTDIGALAVSLANQLANAKDSDEFLSFVCAFYRRYGVGALGLNKAFYLSDDGGINPVSHFKKVSFSQLWGYEFQKEQIVQNTMAFLNNQAANNLLLYGDSGTGKSTCIKALLNMCYENGLRMIQIQKHQFSCLSELIDKIKSRNYRFVLYMDDLSFEEFETEYKYLKAAIEGGLEEKPENVLIYATSNRRHLIKETFDERDGNDIHRRESIEEKISLSQRFGLSVLFVRPSQSEYFDMVRFLAKHSGIDTDEKELIKQAQKWSLSHNGFSGRIAQQFIHSLQKTDKDKSSAD